MEPIIYRREGDPLEHSITAEIVTELECGNGIGLTFRVKDGQEEIDDVDVEVISAETAFISGVGPGEKINNGYLLPASRAIAACMHEDYPTRFGHTSLFGLDDQPIG